MNCESGASPQQDPPEVSDFLSDCLPVCPDCLSVWVHCLSVSVSLSASRLYPRLSVRVCLCLSVSVCVYQCLSVSVCVCLYLSVSACDCLCLSVSVCVCLSLSVSFCLCFLRLSPCVRPSVRPCGCPSLSISVCFGQWVSRTYIHLSTECPDRPPDPWRAETPPGQHQDSLSNPAFSNVTTRAVTRLVPPSAASSRRQKRRRRRILLQAPARASFDPLEG